MPAAPPPSQEPLAYLNGKYLPASQASVSVTDAGFVQGVTVAEQLRTFRGRLFRLEQHLQRLARSLQIVGIDPGVQLATIAETAQRLVAHNHALLDQDDDLGLSIFITPGTYATFRPQKASFSPMVGLHTYPLPFYQWADKYEKGQSLLVTSVRQVPSVCWPAELKCRSRMHYYLADRRAQEIDATARALMLEIDGTVTEASTANLVLYKKEHGLLSPPRKHILPGISVSVLAELAAELPLPFDERVLHVEDVAAADEVLLCSTSPCVWPVLRFNGERVGTGRPGTIFKQLLDAWSRLVQLNIPEQARIFANR